jgi:hypothetical protein
MRSRIVASVLSMLAAMVLCLPAHADYPWMFAQMVCAPTLGYFSIRRITIMNLPKKGPYLTKGLEPGPRIAEALRRTSLIFDSEGLKAEPFTCSIPGFTSPPGWGEPKRAAFNVKVVGHHDSNSEESSYCRIADNAEVFLNGRSIGLITLNPCVNGGETPIIIEVAHNGVELAINKCVEPSIFDDHASNKIVCSETSTAGDAR